MRIDILGCRGSTPTPGREFDRYGGETSCVALSTGGSTMPTLLLDAGTGLRHLPILLGDEPFRGSILLSHLHWDHTHGLPFSPPLDRDASRVDLYLPAQDADPEELLGRVLGPPHFPIPPAGLQGRWRFLALDEGQHEVEGLLVLAREIPHKGDRTFGYRVADGQQSLAYLPDHAPGPAGSGPSGLGELHPAAVELAAGVDLLIHDCQCTAADYPDKAGLGHATAEYAVELATKAGVETLLLFHHDPSRTDTDIDQIVSSLPPSPVDIRAAQQGMSIVLR